MSEALLTTHSKSRTPWRWPLGELGSRRPIILDEHVTDDGHSVDVGYVVASYDRELYVPVYAVYRGNVREAADGAVTIDHGELTTRYSHLTKLFVSAPTARRRQHVRAGDVIGYAAKAPAHVRFEVRKDGRHIDPRPLLDRWVVTSWRNDIRLPLAPTGEAA